VSQQDIEQIYKDIRKRMHKKFEQRKEFGMHAVAYGFSMLFIWLILFSPGSIGGRGIFEFIATLFSGAWTLGILMHGIDFGVSELRERAITQEIERVRLFDKRKNDDIAYRLSDDGEILENSGESSPDDARQDRA